MVAGDLILVELGGGQGSLCTVSSLSVLISMQSWKAFQDQFVPLRSFSGQVRILLLGTRCAVIGPGPVNNSQAFGPPSHNLS